MHMMLSLHEVRIGSAGVVEGMDLRSRAQMYLGWLESVR